MEVIFLRAFTYGYQLLPIAAFLGALVFGALIAKRGELTALYVGGYSTWQIGRPIIGTALFMALFTLWAGQVSIPWATNRLVAMRGLDSAVRQQAGPSLEQWFKNGPSILHLPGVNIEEKKLIDVLVFKQDSAGEIREWFSAAALQYLPKSAGQKTWLLKDGRHFLLATDGSITAYNFAEEAIDLSVHLPDLLDSSGRPSQLTLGELEESIARRERTGRLTRYHLYEYHQRFVYPLSLLVLVLISIPLALVPDKNRSISGALGSGTIVAAWAYGITYLSRSMMSSGSISPIAASWGALLVTFFGAMLFYLFLKRFLRL
jgi:lipopolysaccharide export LptBFGC system permease protein LptF